MRHELGRGVAVVVAGVVSLVCVRALDASGPADDSMKLEVGRRLFFDASVGRRGRVGCADCHQPDHGFSDARTKSVDEDRKLPRHSQPSVDLAGEGFHWDGRFGTVRDLIDARVFGVTPPEVSSRLDANPRGPARVMPSSRSYYSPSEEDPDPELEPATVTPVAYRLAEDDRYAPAFRAAFGDALISQQRVGEALEAYVGSLRTATNALDRHLAGDHAALRPAAARGLGLFRGKAGCAECHTIDPEAEHPLLTDRAFHATGLEFRRSRSSDLGRGAVTNFSPDDFAFKTPSLRDVAQRAPYMHDGSIATLADVVAYYDGGGIPNRLLDPRIHALHLTADERVDLVSFLEALTGEERPGLASPRADRPLQLRVEVQDLEGRPMPGLTMWVVPCGDRLRGAEAVPPAFGACTQADGRAEIAWPPTTHVRLESDAYELGLTRPIPDFVTSQTVIATPKSIVSLRMRRRGTADDLPATLIAARLGASRRDQRPNGPWKFELLRRLGDDEALYTTSVDRAAGRVVADLSSSAPRQDLGTFEIDLSGGATETIDLAHTEHAVPLPKEDLGRR